MKRILLALLILGLIVATVPPLRARARPHVERFGEFMGEKLEGPLSPILTPYRTLRSEAEMGEFVRELIADRNAGYVRPHPGNFRAYIQRKVDDEDGLDAWGTPYILVPEQDSVSIVSAGADRAYETEDDVVAKIRYGAPAYMPGRRRR